MEKNKEFNILIVDDEKGLRVGTQRLLSLEGFNVEVAECGLDGIKLGTSKEFDLAVIDLKMPDVDGIEVLREIKKAKPNTICFIATAFASIETAIDATRIGAFGYISKPFTPEELLYHIEKGLKQRSLILEASRLKHEREERLLELAYEKSRLNTIVKSISNGVLVVNKSGEVVYHNDAALKQLDLHHIEIGKSILEVLPEEISENINKILKSDNFIHKSYSTQVEIKDNNELVVEATCSAVPNTDGSLAGVVLATKNITEFKKIELVKNQFVSMVAHELKTPIAAVEGFLKIIIDDSIDVSYEQQQQFMSRSIIRLEGLLSLVNDLLDISRMEMKTQQRELQNLDIREVVSSTVQFLEIDLKKKGIKVYENYDEDLPELYADVNEITRLITNLLSNAIKYNKDRGSINIDVSKINKYLQIKIADTGIGLKPEDKERLFQQFFRAKNKFTRGISGTGLGLAIVKRIVDSYHGKLKVESEFELGTTFIIELPINK